MPNRRAAESSFAVAKSLATSPPETQGTVRAAGQRAEHQHIGNWNAEERPVDSNRADAGISCRPSNEPGGVEGELR